MGKCSFHSIVESLGLGWSGRVLPVGWMCFFAWVAATAGWSAPSTILSSSAYTRWQAAVVQLLSVPNSSLAQRALAEIAEAGSQLDRDEQPAAQAFLYAALLAALDRPPDAPTYLFAPDMARQCEGLFAVLNDISWTGGAAATFARCLEHLAVKPPAEIRARVLHPPFATLCRAAHPAPAILEKLVRAAAPAPAAFQFLLETAELARPDMAEMLATIFTARFSMETNALVLAEAFQVFADLPPPAAAGMSRRRRILADWFLQNTVPTDWAIVPASVMAEMAAAGSLGFAEWERRIAEAVPAAPALKDALLALIAAQDDLPAAQAALLPVLGNNPRLFSMLHFPTNGVMNLLNRSPANRRANQQILINIFTGQHALVRDAELADVLAFYYTVAASRAEQNHLFELAVRPIVLARLAPDFTQTQAEQPLLRRWLSILTAKDAFLMPRHRRELLGALREGLDWEAPLAAEDAIWPCYQLIARAYVALAEHPTQIPESEADALLKEITGTAAWLLRGALARPDRLGLQTPAMAAALRDLLAGARVLAGHFHLQLAAADLAAFLPEVEYELKAAASDLRRNGADHSPDGKLRRERLVRAVRLSLVLGIVFENENFLNQLMELLGSDLFGLPPPGASAGIAAAPDDLNSLVALFRVIDEDLAAGLENLPMTAAVGRKRAEFLREFALRYHRDVQVRLALTPGFLARLYFMDEKLTPFRRLLSADEKISLAALRQSDVLKVFSDLAGQLDRAPFLNSTDALAELLRIYQTRLRFSFWRNPLAAGLNRNVNIPVLFKMLQNEPSPMAEDGGQADAWPLPAYLSVIDALLAGLEAGPENMLVREVEYDQSSRPLAVEVCELAPWLRRIDCLLRAQELLSFPISLEPLAAEVPPVDMRQSALAASLRRIANVMAAGAVAPDFLATLPAPDLPPDMRASRQVDGGRRAQLCRLALRYARTPDDVLAAAECAVLLPNAPRNAADKKMLREYDRLRADVFQRLRACVSESSDAEFVAQGLIVLLRLDAAQRRDGGGGSNCAALLADSQARLTAAGRRRVGREYLALQSAVSQQANASRCAQHSAAPDLTCRACRDASAERLAPVVALLRGLLFAPDAPTSPAASSSAAITNVALAQLAALQDRLHVAAAEVSGMDADAVKSAWSAVRCFQNALAAVPPEWRILPGWTAALAPSEPLAVQICQAARLFSAAYSMLLPLYGNVNLGAFLGEPDRPASGNAIAAFSLLDAEMKDFLLEASALEKRAAGNVQTPLTALAPAELAALHSAWQPALALGIWEYGTNRLADGVPLMEFIGRGRQYDERVFDPDLLLETGGSFAIQPKNVFVEALRALDLMAAAIAQTAVDGQPAIYHVWFGDVLAALGRRLGATGEILNMDRFLTAAARILDDRRYENYPGPLRDMARDFQQELKSWVGGGGSAVIARSLASASSPLELAAMAERIADRLGMPAGVFTNHTLPALPVELRDIYADFCRRCLFDGAAVRPVFPAAVSQALCEKFLVQPVGTAPEDIESGRRRFADMLAPFVLGGTNSAAAVQGGGLEDLYCRTVAAGDSASGYWLIGDFMHAYLQLLADIYWYGGREGAATNTVALSWPWRLDANGRSYLATALPEGRAPSAPLHGADVWQTFAWRSACALALSNAPGLAGFFAQALSSPVVGGIPPWDVPAEIVFDPALARRLAELARGQLTRLDARELLLADAAKKFSTTPQMLLDELDKQQADIAEAVLQLAALADKHAREARDQLPASWTFLPAGGNLSAADLTLTFMLKRDGAPTELKPAERWHWCAAAWQPLAAGLVFSNAALSAVQALGLLAAEHVGDPEWAWVAFLHALRQLTMESDGVRPTPAIQKLTDELGRHYAASGAPVQTADFALWQARTEELTACHTIAALWQPELLTRWTMEGGAFAFDAFDSRFIEAVALAFSSGVLASILRNDFPLPPAEMETILTAYRLRQGHLATLAVESAGRQRLAPDMAPGIRRLYDVFMLPLARFPPCLSVFQPEKVNDRWLKFVRPVPSTMAAAEPAALAWLCHLQADFWRNDDGVWLWRPRTAGWRDFLSSNAQQ